MTDKIAAIWARVSTEDKQEPSLNSQVADVKTWLESQGWIVPSSRIMTVHWTSKNILACPDMQKMLVGQKNLGFYIAMGTLEFERSQLGATVGRENIINDLTRIMKRTECDGRPLSQDEVLRQELAQHWIETKVMKYMGLRMLTSQLKGETTGPKANLGFVMAGESIQRLQDFAMRILGPYGQLARGSRHAVDNGRWLRSYLSSRGIPTIGGGPVEIKRNIIAMRVLGLPRSY